MNFHQAAQDYRNIPTKDFRDKYDGADSLEGLLQFAYKNGENAERAKSPLKGVPERELCPQDDYSEIAASLKRIAYVLEARMPYPFNWTYAPVAQPPVPFTPYTPFGGTAVCNSGSATPRTADLTPF